MSEKAIKPEATSVYSRIVSYAEEGYARFTEALNPTLSPDSIIGVRVPTLRKIVRTLTEYEREELLSTLPHGYLEEYLLHIFIINGIKDIGAASAAVDRLLPYLESWCETDCLLPRAYKKGCPELLRDIYRWLKSSSEFTVRYAIVLLMKLYLSESFDSSYPEAILSADLSSYYVGMAAAWYFATALFTNYAEVIGYIENRRLPEDIHRKAIRKALESYRISPETKAYLKSLI
ncbi:MAG: DNA alkylation repair protein [Clostridia bacterium]|nr:DNA alkylation repair protein [Clostridia bacterium]